MKEKLEQLLLNQKFLIGAWALQTLWYVVLHLLHMAGSGGALMGVFLAGNVLLAYLIPIYTLAFIAYGFVRRDGYIRYKAIPVGVFLLCYIGQTIIYAIVDRVLV
ncbi:MAG: hypothetical protein IJ109_10255 [Firmicutes bacterium]|nr:hypothetical protein [Bacillota bacterium]